MHVSYRVLSLKVCRWHRHRVLSTVWYLSNTRLQMNMNTLNSKRRWIAGTFWKFHVYDYTLAPLHAALHMIHRESGSFENIWPMSHSYRVVHVAMLIDAINIEIGCIECDIMKPNEIHGVFHYYSKTMHRSLRHIISAHQFFSASSFLHILALAPSLQRALTT